MDQRKVMQGLIARIAVGVFGLLTVAMLLLAIFDDRGVLAVHGANKNLAEINSDIDVLKKKNEDLQKDIHNLRHDPATIERLARERLKLVKPGEVILESPETPKK